MVNFRKSVRPWSNVLNILTEQHWKFVHQSRVSFSDVQLLGAQTYWTFCWIRVNFALTFTPTAHARTEQMFSDWSNALNNTQHFKKQRKCWVAQHLFSEKFDCDKTSLNKTQQGWTRLNKVVKRSEHFAVNKCFVLFSEIFSTFDWGLRKSGKRTSYFHDNCVQQCKQYKSYKDKTFLRNLQMHMYQL